MMEAGFDVLAPGGHFIELGKRDLKSPGWVAARGRDLRYSIVDWSEDAAEHPSVIGAMLAKLADQMARGLLKPLPRHVFASEDASRAFRLMAQAKHVGKIVLRHGGTARQIVRRDGTYLITGGMSGLGLRTAEWLAEKGAGRVVLIGRREPGPQATAAMDRMRAAGTQVQEVPADVTDAAALGTLLASLRSEGPPLRGVIHAAGVLCDAAFLRHDTQMLTDVLAPKLQGARLLDQLTRVDALDWFVMYSSIAGVLGAAGQAGYAAANAALDQLAYERRQRGLCATSIAWGAWEEIGAAATLGLHDRHAARGLYTLSPTVSLAALERVLEDDCAQVCVASMDWTRYVATDHGASRSFLTELLGGRTSAAAVAARAKSQLPLVQLQEELAQAPTGRRRAVIAGFVAERACRILGMDASRQLDPSTPLGDIGLDSLLAVELRNVLGTSLGKALPATLLFEYPTLDALTDYLLTHLLGNDEPSTPEQPILPSDLLGTIEALSDEEIDRMLATRAEASA
jgi:NAD(P)-dependent dehydrogenase (short-subunit alcohol dehydrogenase family)